ncbi:MAG: hypothetical protein AB1416_11260, partial [Actinomycetota bacterium]
MGRGTGRLRLAAAVAGAGLVAAGVAGAASLGDPRATALPGIPAADRAAIAGFERWTRLAVPPPVSQRGLGSAHPGPVTVVASPRRSVLVRAGRQRFPYPVGTRIVKTARTGGAITLVAIMRKAAKGGTAAGWRYVEYTRPSGAARFTKVAFPESGCD